MDVAKLNDTFNSINFDVFRPKWFYRIDSLLVGRHKVSHVKMSNVSKSPKQRKCVTMCQTLISVDNEGKNPPGMDLQFIFVCDTYFHHIVSNVQALYNNRAVKIFTIQMVFLRLTVMNQPFLEISEKSLSYVLTIQIKPVDHYERSLGHLQIASAP